MPQKIGDAIQVARLIPGNKTGWYLLLACVFVPYQINRFYYSAIPGLILVELEGLACDF